MSIGNSIVVGMAIYILMGFLFFGFRETFNEGFPIKNINLTSPTEIKNEFFDWSFYL